MGTGMGTILEYDSSKNIIPSTGTYNTVSEIDKAITDLQNSVPNVSYILVGPNVSLQKALADAQISGKNTEIFLPAGDYTVRTVASLTTAAGQNVTINGAGRGTTCILATSIYHAWG
jgi:cellobiose-specific phosphotransferase system component IIB